MGYKTRSNYVPGYNLTEEQFNNIFKKKGPQNESEKKERRKSTNQNCMEEKTG